MKHRIELNKEQVEFIVLMTEAATPQEAMKEFGATMVDMGLSPKDMSSVIDRISKVWYKKYPKK